MTIDETLFPYRGHISINNYKPACYGLLFISISDAEVPYTYYSLPYVGKPEIPNEYYVPGTDEKSMYLVTKLRLYCNLTGWNIMMDRYFTSLSIADWLLERNMTVVGTMKDNRVRIPQKLRNPHGFDQQSQCITPITGEKKMLVSWADKKKSGLKNILMLDMHDIVKVSRDE